MVRDYIVEAVVANANKHEARWTRRAPYPYDVTEARRLCTLMQEELGELAQAINNKHEHPPELELLQIGGFVLNWLSRVIADPEHMRKISDIDDVKHPAPHTEKQETKERNAVFLERLKDVARDYDSLTTGPSFNLREGLSPYHWNGFRLLKFAELGVGSLYDADFPHTPEGWPGVR